MFSMWPPSERCSHALSSAICAPNISRRSSRKPGFLKSDQMFGFLIQKPRRTFRKVSKAVSAGIEPSPIRGAMAAPEIAIAVARSGCARFINQDRVGP